MNVIPVPEQSVVSGDFPTVESPNPEEPSALSMAIEKAKAVDADIVMASDPDADRMGIAIKNDRGQWVLINGNQTATLFIYYLLTRWKEMGRLTGNEYVVKTIVTTELIKKIADKFHVTCFDCYTGFKWIAAVMRNMEGKMQYIGGGEESYGFLPEDFVRDKDAVSSCALMAEITAWAKNKGLSLYQLLLDVYVEFGYSKEKGFSLVKKGKEGADEIQQLMTAFRNQPPSKLDGSPVVLIKDFKHLVAREPLTGHSYPLEMPDTSDVLQFFTEDETKVSIRPSGTEPKIKFYMEVKEKLKRRDDIDAVSSKASARITAIKTSLGLTNEL
jgi:phosphoglucomutase